MKMTRTILYAWVALLVLLCLTIGASFLPLGKALVFVNYGVAVTKTAIIVWIFMEMRQRDGLERLALGVGFIWLFFLYVLTFADVLTRGWLGI